MSESRQRAIDAAARLCNVGCEAYFSGGCVRDYLLVEEPHDYDIATDANPEQVQALFPKSQAVGVHFGVVVVRSGSDHIELATFRTDGSFNMAGGLRW